ncbi:MAG: hypothetical protein ACJ8F7_01805 [Gemmataceae bacterium]
MMPLHDWGRVGERVFYDFHCSWMVEIKRALNRGRFPKRYYVNSERFQGALDAPKEYAPHLPGVNVVRQVGDDRVVAHVAILSSRIKTNQPTLCSFVDAAVAALSNGVHLLIVDVHRPVRTGPNEIHSANGSEFGHEELLLGTDRPPAAVAYIAGSDTEGFAELLVVGAPVPEMPLFLTKDHSIQVPLEATYMAAWEDVPSQYQEALLAPR